MHNGNRVERKTKAISVKMTPSDWDKCVKMARDLWPGARMTNADILMSLAMQCVESKKKA